jgi:hypothetical protein
MGALHFSPDFEGPSRQLSKSSAREKNQVQKILTYILRSIFLEIPHLELRADENQSLVQIGPVVLEELIKMQKANDRQTPSGSNSSPNPS